MIGPKDITKAMMLARQIAEGIGLGKPDALDRPQRYADGGLASSIPKIAKNIKQSGSAASDYVHYLYGEDPRSDIAYAFDLNTVTDRNIDDAKKYIKNVSQDALKRKFGDQVTLYRGIKGTEASSPTLSFTLNPSTARFHADQQGPKTGVVHKITVPVSHVLSYSDALNQGHLDEKEVIIPREYYEKALSEQPQSDVLDKPQRYADGGYLPPGHPEREENLNKYLSHSQTKDIWYHATPKNFSEFKPGGEDPEVSGHAIWLSNSKTDQPANHHIRGYKREGTNVMPLYARANRPLVIDDPETHEWAKNAFADGNENFPHLMPKKWADAVQKEGYDSVLFADPHKWGDPHELIVFHDTQVKSAIGNRGTYDLNERDLTKADGGYLPADEEINRQSAANKYMEGSVAPSVMYHGTTQQKLSTKLEPDEDDLQNTIKVFKGMRGHSKAPIAGFAAFDPKVAEIYAGAGQENKTKNILKERGSIYPVKVRATKIFDIANPEHRKLAKMTRTLQGREWVKNIPEDVYHWGWRDLEANAHKIKKAGFDSYYDYEHGIHQGPTGIGVFDPTQIKSVFAKRFDQTDPDIGEKRGGMVYADGGKAELYYSPGHPEREANLAKFMEGAHPSVLNEDGTPKVLYHGTTHDFTNFKKSTTGEFGPGVYLTDSPLEAESYSGMNRKDPNAGPNIVPVHVNLKNPFVIKNNPSEFWDAFKSRSAIEADEASVKRAIEAGHDGVLFHRPLEAWNNELQGIVPTGKMQTHIVVFHPHQIKSAIGNRGTFDPNEPDITKADGGMAYGDGGAAEEESKRQAAAAKYMEGSEAPPVMYHGTTQGKVRAFASPDSKEETIQKFKSTRGHPDAPVAGFAAFDPKFAEWFANFSPKDKPHDYTESVMYPVKLRAKNIFDIANPKHRHAAGIEDKGGEPYYFHDLEENTHKIAGAGFDSYYDYEHGTKEKPTGIAVFEPTQIKSVFAKRFDPHHPDIGEKRGGMVYGDGGTVPDQEISSADTSIRQVPALFKSQHFQNKPKGWRNLDIGGGRYDDGTQHLSSLGVESHVFDPFNRTEEHNQKVLNKFGKKPADSVSLANVLNVIREPEARLSAIALAHKYLKPEGTAYFDVYEGDRSGKGKKTSKGYQNNKPAEHYLEEVRSHFPDAYRKGSTIVAPKSHGGMAYAGGGEVEEPNPRAVMGGNYPPEPMQPPKTTTVIGGPEGKRPKPPKVWAQPNAPHETFTDPNTKRQHVFQVSDPNRHINMASQAKEVSDALAHHFSLPRMGQFANSLAAQKRLIPYVGEDDAPNKPKPFLTMNAKLEKASQGYEAGKTYEGQDPLDIAGGYGVKTIGMPMSPAMEHGKFQICGNAEKCKASCLGTTSGKYANEDWWPQQNSKNKTHAFISEPGALAIQLHNEIMAQKTLSALEGKQLAVRLNVLSDIHPKVWEPLIKAHPDVDFYDYTKMNYDPVAPNHHLTYSSTGVSQPEGINGIKEGVKNPRNNWRQVRGRLDAGSNVAMVFSHKEHLPEEVYDHETGNTYKVIDGTTHDYRPLDKQPEGSKGVIIGLKNLASTKGMTEDNAHQQSNGFIVHYDPQLKKQIGKSGKEINKVERGPSPGLNKEGKPIPGPTIPQNRRVEIADQGKDAYATGGSVDHHRPMAPEAAAQQFHNFHMFDTSDDAPVDHDEKMYEYGGVVEGDRKIRTLPANNSRVPDHDPERTIRKAMMLAYGGQVPNSNRRHDPLFGPEPDKEGKGYYVLDGERQYARGGSTKSGAMLPASVYSHAQHKPGRR